MIKLYDFPQSPHCQKVRLALSEKDLSYEKVLVDLLGLDQLLDALQSRVRRRLDLQLALGPCLIATEGRDVGRKRGNLYARSRAL